MTLVVGVDSSTQSSTVEVRRLEDGALVWAGGNPHPATTPPRSEQDPDDWWRALQPLLDAAWAAAGAGPAPGPHAPGIAAVSVAAQQHGMVVLDEARRVLRPAKLWNDTESAAEAAALVDRLGGPAASAAACGSVIGPAFTLAKLAWLARHEPRVHGAVAHVVLPHDWLTWCLSGELVTDRGDASGTGYWSPARGAWLPESLRLVGLDPAVVPRLAAPFEAVGRVGGVLVAPGTGDNMAAALGLGLEPGDVAVSLGTSGTVYAVSERPTADATGAVAGFADATGRFLPLVCTLNATKVTDWVARLLGVDHAGLDRLALEAPPGAGGVVLVPYLDGERTPALPAADGVLSGLRTDTAPAQLARAAFEGVVCGLLEGLDALETAGVATGGGRVVLTGGGARSAAYARVLADLLQRDVAVRAAGSSVATGAALQAAATLTGQPPGDLAGAWGLRRGQLVEPDPAVDAAAVRAAYRAASTRAYPGR